MTSATGIMSYLNLTRLVEEVPGVPDDERYYLWHKRTVEARFGSYEAGVEYAAEHGITIDQFEGFEP